MKKNIKAFYHKSWQLGISDRLKDMIWKHKNIAMFYRPFHDNIHTIFATILTNFASFYYLRLFSTKPQKNA